MRSARFARTGPCAAELLFACALATGACSREQSAGDHTADVADDDDRDPIAFSVELDETTVPLGADLSFRVKLENTGSHPVDVNVPRIGRRSFVLRVTKGTRVSVVERLNARLDPANGQFVWSPGESRKLAPGEKLEQTITTTALEVGSFTVLPMYTRMGADTATAEPIHLDVRPVGDKTTLGARIATSKGEVLVRLRPDLAYNTVESFVALAKRHFYDGLTFHRVIPGFMAQGGCPLGNGNGDPGYMLPLEAHTKLLHDRGILSMARTGLPDTAGSQFFLMFTRYPSLDPGFRGEPGYTVFGQMVSGDATLDALEAAGTVPDGRTKERLTIDKITIELLE